MRCRLTYVRTGRGTFVMTIKDVRDFDTTEATLIMLLGESFKKLEPFA